MMTLLAVDIGNTDIKFGIFQDDRLTRFWRVSGSRSHPERFSALLRTTLAEQGINFDGLVYCTVVPEVEHVLVKTIQYCYQLKHPPLAVHAGQARLPVRVADYPLNQLGTDRLVNVCGAHLLYPDQPLIVIDFGTATTFDAVTAEGVFLGGAIAPGLKLFSEILPSRTSRLMEVPLVAPTRALGRNTQECMQSGIGLGYHGLVKEILEGIKAEFPPTYRPIMTLATGGLADTFYALRPQEPLPQEPLIQAFEPTLTLKGLWAIYHYNRQLVSPGRA